MMDNDWLREIAIETRRLIIRNNEGCTEARVWSRKTLRNDMIGRGKQ